MNQLDRTPRAGVPAGLAAVLVVVALPAAAFAAEGGGHHPGIGSLLPYVVNFLLFVGVLVWRGRRPMSDFLVERRDRLVREVEEAEDKKAAAERALREVEERLAGIEGEVERILTEAKQMADAEHARLVGAAEATAARLEREATFAVEQEPKRARAELRREVIDLAARDAEQRLQGAVSADDQQRLVHEFLDREVSA